MIQGKSVLALIPARGGSKGIKNKNIIDLCGKPLIAYTIMAAQKSCYVDSVVVTTDSTKIAQVSLSYGARVPFFRPKELATDHSRTLDAVLHAITVLHNEHNENYDILLLLQPTQPLRDEHDIDKALEIFIASNCKGVVSVNCATDSPLLLRTITENHLYPILNQNSTFRRQDMPTYYRVNGAIYVNAITEINEATSFNDNPIPCVMDRKHSVDIDDSYDLFISRTIMKLRKDINNEM